MAIPLSNLILLRQHMVSRATLSVQVEDDASVLAPFQSMSVHRVGGVAVVEKGSGRLVGNISARDVCILLNETDRFPKKR